MTIGATLCTKLRDLKEACEQWQFKRMVASVLGSIYADSTITTEADREAKVNYVMGLVETARSDSVSPGEPENARLEVRALYRASEVPGLDSAAKALTGVTAALTALFTGIGFSTGDFARMIRDHQDFGLAFIILVGVALLLGSFAVSINAYKSAWNLRGERLALRAGIACATVAFICAAWGLSQGASATQTSPSISASFDTTGKSPVLKVTAGSSAVPQSRVLAATVWGKPPNSTAWQVLTYVVAGPDHDGDASLTISVDDVSTYAHIVAQAGLSARGAAVPSLPSLLWDTSDTILAGDCPDGQACQTLAVPST